jgi:hypothetical protein
MRAIDAWRVSLHRHAPAVVQVLVLTAQGELSPERPAMALTTFVCLPEDISVAADMK